MTNREDLEAVLEGGRPARIPLAIYEMFVNGDPCWQALFTGGLCLIGEASTVKETLHNVELVRMSEMWCGKPAERLTLRTPVGEISQLSVAGWVQEHFLKRPADYRVMTYIVENKVLEPDPRLFIAKEQEIGDSGLTLGWLGRSPMQTILVDYAGLENFSYHLADGFPELFDLAEALLTQLVERCRLVAAGLGRYFSLLENLTAEQWGPQRFARYHLPVYEKILPILHAGGKKVYAHFDGQLAALADLVARTELDGIESLTSPPEGDMTYAEARAVWPDKVIWGNINVSCYDLPPARLRARVLDLVHQAAPDGRRLILEVSEDLPANWKQSLPVVLEALAEGLAADR